MSVFLDQGSIIRLRGNNGHGLSERATAIVTLFSYLNSSCPDQDIFRTDLRVI